MLQPSQLIGVCLRYPEEILELRTFLAKAGLTPGSAETLSGIVDRLSWDRGFRRDLTSQVWVAIHRSDGAVSYSDLLGMLAVAAAGTEFASAAADADAHDLLRFLMEARRSFDGVQGVENGDSADATVVPAVVPQTSPVDWELEPEVSEPSLQPFHRNRFVPQGSQETTGGSRRLAPAAAACVVLALAIGVWLQHRSTVSKSNNSASILPVSTGARAANPLPGKTEPSLPRSHTSARAAFRTWDRPAKPLAAPSLPASAVSHDIPHTPVTQATPSFALPAEASTAAKSGDLSDQSIARVRPVTPTVSQAAPAYASTSPKAAVRGAKVPRLLRRTDSGDSADYADLTPAVSGAGPSTTPDANRTRAGNSAPGGIVRPTSLGIMAANVLYSPLPPYPAAASTAHVQGEVKVEADVDRNGNVASARVISGPPLLRDAALDAVQRWRYRPYLSYGKPEPKTALAIVDFQLP